ncbi:MAG: carboxylating nicotinate-nucleotide diphosphorylase [Planctomycetota bacterium]|nr:carboxylating nicotinate-nucleotide diphosphorylase [Planctomycetota bacterium]
MSAKPPSIPTSSPELQPPPLFERLRMSLLEDFGASQEGDVTSRALVPSDRRVEGYIVAKEDGVICGVNVLGLIFQMAEELISPAAQDRAALLHEAGNAARAGAAPLTRVSELAEKVQREGFQVKVLHKDGARVGAGTHLAELEGNARAMLFGERTALNILCHLSGVATQTARYVACCAGTKAQVVDTRKTTPLWRDLEKYAVTCGGGVNHRRGLYDMVLIKDNHLALWGTRDPAQAVIAAQARFPDLKVEIEVTELATLARVCKHSRPDYVLLDNFDPQRVREAVTWCDAYYKDRAGRPQLEASGGITLETLSAYANAGVDRISVGALTHSVKTLDLSLEIKI